MDTATHYTLVQLPPAVLYGIAVLSVLQLLVIIWTVMQVLRTVRATGRIIEASSAAICKLTATTEELGRQVHACRTEPHPKPYIGRSGQLAPAG